MYVRVCMQDGCSTKHVHTAHAPSACLVGTRVYLGLRGSFVSHLLARHQTAVVTVSQQRHERAD